MISMFLIYPGMTDFEEVEILEPAEPGYCWVRPFNSDDQLKVSIGRLVDEATARTRKSTEIIERDGYTVAVHTVTAI